jgi:hypothetical protein
MRLGHPMKTILCVFKMTLEGRYFKALKVFKSLGGIVAKGRLLQKNSHT